MGGIIPPIGIEDEYFNAIISKNEERVLNLTTEGKALGTVVPFIFKNSFFHTAVLLTSFENITVSNNAGNTSVMINEEFDDDTCIVIQLVSVINTDNYRISYTTHKFTQFIKYDLFFFPPISGLLTEGILKLLALSATPITYNTARENCLDYCKKLLLLLHEHQEFESEQKKNLWQKYYNLG